MATADHVTAALAQTGRAVAPLIATPQLLMDVEDARTSLGGISRATIYGLINSRQLATVKLGGRRFVIVESMRALVEANRDKAA